MFGDIKDSQFILYSQGCCGTHQMNNCLKAAGLNIYGPKEHNPHTRRPPKDYKGKILFMYADPRNILLSAINHAIYYNTSSDWSRSHCRNLEGDVKYFGSKVTVERILKDQYDPFKLYEHFINWLTTDICHFPNNGEMMILKYEALEEPAIFQKVLDFFDISGNYSFNWKPRISDFTILPAEQRIRITELFLDLLMAQEKLTPCFIR